MTEMQKAANKIINRAKRKGIETNSIKEYKEVINYIKKNKNDIDEEEALNLATERFLKDDDLTAMFDMRKKSNRTRLENIKKTMFSSGQFESEKDISNQDIIDYIENIRNITDNINIMNNLPSEQVGEIYLRARNKDLDTSDLLSLIIEAESSANTYGQFIDILYDLID